MKNNENNSQSVTEEVGVELEKQDKKLFKKREPKEKKIKEKKIKEKMDPAKKKKVIKRSIFGGIAAVVIAFFLVNNIVAAGAKPAVYVSTVAKGDIEQTLTTSGSVTAEQVKAYFSEAALKVGTINVKAGEAVAKGQPIITYDVQSLANEKKTAELTLAANEGGLHNNEQKNNESWGDLGEANVNLGVLEQQITDFDNYIKELQKKVDDKKAALAHEGSLLQISLIDWADQPDSEEYMNLQKLVQINQYEQTNNQEIRDMQAEINKYSEMLQNCKEYKSEMKSQKNSADSTKLTAGGKQELEAKAEIEKIDGQDLLNAIVKVENGMLAEFDGVVTEMAAIEGATPAAGTQLFKLESTQDVKVSISVTKYDLEKIAVGQKSVVTIAGRKYDGEVTKIDKMATKNASGAPVVNADVKILNPDENIFLGVEAKISINTASAKATLIVPVGVVNTDKEGDFVYIVENGVIAKRQIITGISSDIQIQILEGLKEGDQILTEATQGITEGMAVTPIPQQ